MKTIENPIPTLLSVAGSTYGAFTLYSMVNHDIITTIGTGISIVFGLAFAYTITVEGMGRYAEENNIHGINKLGAIIALQYAFLVPAIHVKILSFIDGRYETIKREYEALPKYDENKLKRFIYLDKQEVEKHNRIIGDVKKEYTSYKNNSHSLIKYLYYSNLKQKREAMDNFSDKRKSLYTVAVESVKSCLPKKAGSAEVAECKYRTRLNKLEQDYKNAISTANEEYPVYVDSNMNIHSMKYKNDISSNSSTSYNLAVETKKLQLKEIEARLPFPYYSLFIIVYLLGFWFETRLANMNVFTRVENLKNKLKSINNGQKELDIEIQEIEYKKEEIVNIRLLKEHEAMMSNLSTADSFLEWANRFHAIENKNKPFKINRDIATLYAVVNCTISTNPTSILSSDFETGLTAKKIQWYSRIVNPKSKGGASSFSVINSQSKIRKKLVLEKALIRNKINNTWSIDEVNLLKVLRAFW